MLRRITCSQTPAFTCSHALAWEHNYPTLLCLYLIKPRITSYRLTTFRFLPAKNAWMFSTASSSSRLRAALEAQALCGVI